MIRNVMGCLCDVCGKLVEADWVQSCDDIYDYQPPSGWLKGVNGGIDICPECAAKLIQNPRDYSSFSKQVK